MNEISLSQAKQATGKSAADAFGPLEDEAIATLQFWISRQGRVLDAKGALDAAKYVLDKLHGRTPDVSQGQEPIWMKVMRKAIQIDGVPVEDLPELKEGTANGIVEEYTFEFVWDKSA